MRADIEFPRMPGHTRISRAALTRDGIVQLESIVVDSAGRRVQPPPVRIHRVVVREKVVVMPPTTAGRAILRCPVDGSEMVHADGWYRCPTEKCKVVI